MIHINTIDGNPIHEIVYEFPQSGGNIASGSFQVFRAVAQWLPGTLQALLVMSDLQGRESSWINPEETHRLLGEVVAEELGILSDLNEFPPRDGIGVILAGDLFVAEELDKRGGKGDVRDIWRRFGKGFRWVCGTAGNHDRFGGNAETSFISDTNIHYLDGTAVVLDGLKIAGVAGVIGNPSKPFRRGEQDFLAAIKTMGNQSPDMLVLHQGPSGIGHGRTGSEAVRHLLERLPPMLVCCGHHHWDSHEINELANGTQVLNVDAKAYLIVGEDEISLEGSNS